MPSYDPNVLNEHRQLFPLSCIPAGVELVLKFRGNLPASEHPEQSKWGNKPDGSFNDYHDRVVQGVRFKMEFAQQRGPSFPIDDLFTRVSDELRLGRFVVISLANPGGWHIYVVTDELPTGEFKAVAKAGHASICVTNVRDTVHRMGGTDILTYTVA